MHFGQQVYYCKVFKSQLHTWHLSEKERMPLALDASHKVLQGPLNLPNHALVLSS